jgi:O-antigen ligase
MDGMCSQAQLWKNSHGKLSVMTIGKTDILFEKFKASFIVRNQNSIISCYALVSLTVALFSWIGPFSAIPKLQTLINTALAGVGLLLLALNLLTQRSIRLVPHYLWFLLFLVSLIVTSVLNSGYGWFENAKTFVWEAIQIGLFLPLALMLPKEDLRRFFKNAFWVLFLFATVSCLVALLEHIFQIGYLFMTTDGTERAHGFINARLYGPFINPNTGSPLALLAIAASLPYLRIFGHTKGMLVFIWASNLINWLYVIASASRGGALCAAAAFVFFVFFYYQTTQKGARRPQKLKFIRNVLIVGLALSISFVGLDQVFVRYAAWQHSKTVNSTLSGFGVSFSADRQDVSLENISNNRFKIWEEYVTFNNDSVLFGKSPRNMIPIIADLHPDSYTAERQFEPHNSMIHVYAATGLLGVIPWAALTLLLLRDFVRFFRQKRTITEPIILCFVLLVILCVKATTSNSLLFTFTADNLIFFMALGYLLNALRPLPKNATEVSAP